MLTELNTTPLSADGETTSPDTDLRRLLSLFDVAASDLRQLVPSNSVASSAVVYLLIYQKS